VFWSQKWETFPDFLSAYLKTKLGPDWGNAELAKPFEQRHPILQWYHHYCEFQKKTAPNADGIRQAPGTGVVWCYLGLAYSLYLLKHNVELQDRLLARLRDSQNFQGAYYELIVANCLIRAGFELELEDEQDTRTKHCEFAARLRTTKRLYSVEAKMRGVAGVLGKGKLDGARNSDPTHKVTEHLAQALKKPSMGERLIFIDVNAKGIVSSEPAWVRRAYERLEKSEKNRSDHKTAYVFVTNMNHHWHLTEEAANGSILGFGYGIHDFAKVGQISLPEAYKQKKKHQIAYEILERFKTYTKLPVTFDGTLLSEAHGKESRRVIVGESYIFDDPIGLAEVTSVSAIPSERKKYIAVHAVNGQSSILAADMTAEEIHDYDLHGDTIFGELRNSHKQVDTPFEFFARLMEIYENYSIEGLLKQIDGALDIDQLRLLPRDELALVVAERVALAVASQSKQGKGR